MTSYGLVRVEARKFCEVVCASFLLVGCGGGTSSGVSTTPPPPTPDYTISATPTSATIPSSGGTATLTVSISAINNFASSVSVSVAALPAGLSASPASFSLTLGAQQSVVITAAVGTQIAAGTVTFQSSSGTLSHTAQASLSVAVGTSVTAAHAPVRTRFLATDGMTWASAYDAVHKRFFLSDPYLNEIEVFDATQEIEIGKIFGPAAWGYGYFALQRHALCCFDLGRYLCYRPWHA